MTTEAIIKKLSNAPGPSGFEDTIITIAKDYLGTGFNFEEDRIRNLFIRAGKPKKNQPTIMLDAHSDEVGFMIQSINTNGTLKFQPLGGWNPQSLSALAVRIQNSRGKWVKGVVASKPTHFMSPEEMKKTPAISNMVIDVGACSIEEIKDRFFIRIGAPAVPDVDFSFDRKNGLLFGKAFDDRLGCAALLEIMKRHIGENPNLNIQGALSSQEELGLRGANVSVRKIDPDVAIVLEGTPADDTFNTPDFIQAGLGKGPQIRHLDRSVLANPRFVRFAVDVAEKNGIKFQEAVRSGGGTNAGVITLHDRSVPTITLGIPVRYIHSPHCIAAMEDVEQTIAWCTAILENLDRETIESF